MKKKFLIFLLMFLLVITISSNLKAEELKAYRGLEFKQTPEEVIDVFLDDSEIRGYPIEKDQIDSFIQKGEGTFTAETTLVGRKTDMLLNFYENQLYNVAFLSKSYTADNFDTNITTIRKDYASLIKNKYGEPDYSQEINFTDVTGKYPPISHRWNIEDKKIVITTEEYESKYSIVMQIIYEPLQAKKNKQKSEEKEKDIEDESSNF